MPRTNKVIMSLNAGELSPLLDARIDQQIKLVEEMLADQLPKNPLEG